MGRKRHKYTLWRDKPGFFGSTYNTGQGSKWFDLEDEVEMARAMTDLIDHHGGDIDYIDQYRLEIRDQVTEERLDEISFTQMELDAIRNGQRSSGTTTPEGSESVPLERASDEALVRELLRRLKR